MEQYRKDIIKYLESQLKIHPNENLIQEILNRLDEPLQDLSISRTSFDWGIPIPNDKKHVMYVWFDALTNYLTSIDYLNISSDKLSSFWSPIHIIGRDFYGFLL